MMWSDPYYHLHIEGQVPYNEGFQRQTMKWASQVDDSTKREFPHLISTRALYPDNLEQTAQSLFSPIERPAMTALLHRGLIALAGNVYILTWRCGGTLCSAMSPDSGYDSWTVELRRRGDCYADCCTDSVTAFET